MAAPWLSLARRCSSSLSFPRRARNSVDSSRNLICNQKLILLVTFRMSESKFREVLPKHGMLAVEDITTMVMCKPKLLPLKSVTLEKLEKMQREAQEIIQQQELIQQQEQAAQQFSTSTLDQ